MRLPQQTDAVDFAAVEVIYPVLLVHDTRLNAPAYGTFLAGEFLALLGSVPSGKRVVPLAVMTIADLENLESSIDQFSLRQLLADYATAHPDGIVSLHNFMAVNPRYAYKLKAGAQLMASPERLIRHAHRELFPGSPNLDPAAMLTHERAGESSSHEHGAFTRSSHDPSL
jgi:hypothetical protein